MKCRLLIDSDVVSYLERLRTSARTEIWKRLQEIADSPDRFADYHEHDVTGRELAVHIFQGHAILYWNDFADRHLKILEITAADDFSL